MFGYVRTDTPYLYIKDNELYRAMYCGVCKGIAETSGNAARMGLSYDVTFLSVIMHNILGMDVKIEKQHCLTHCIRSRSMAEVDELTRQLGALNTVLVYYKYTDDINDGDKGRGKRLWFKEGFKKVLVINGVGYRAEVQGDKLVLNLGYSNDFIASIPANLTVAVDGQNKISISGIDKQAVGEYAAGIRKLRGPEPYKGKGIRYETEVIKRKVGKSGVK